MNIPEKTPRRKRMINLGYSNGWGSTLPAEWAQCKQAGHALSCENAGHRLTRYWCPECGYEFTVDSSD